MSRPRWESATSVVQSTGSATITGNRPSGTADGETLVASIALPAAQSISSVPTGWSLVHRISASGPSSVAIYWKIAASEPASWDWTRSAAAQCASAQVHRISGAHAASPVHVYDGTGASGTGTSIVAPSITPTISNCLLLALASTRSFDTVTTATFPAGMVERIDDLPQVADDVHGAFGGTEWYPNPGATGTRTITITVAGWWSVSFIAIRPPDWLKLDIRAA